MFSKLFQVGLNGCVGHSELLRDFHDAQNRPCEVRQRAESMEYDLTSVFEAQRSIECLERRSQATNGSSTLPGSAWSSYKSWIMKKFACRKLVSSEKPFLYLQLLQLGLSHN